MSKRKSRGTELSSLSPLKSSTDKLPELVSPSCSSSSSSKSYSSKMIVHDKETCTKEDNDKGQCAKPNSVAVTKEMVLIGCPRCYMFVMSSEDEPKCPKCNTTVFLDLFRED